MSAHDGSTGGPQASGRPGPLAHEVVLVTGASLGIGAAVVAACAAAGARVAGLSRRGGAAAQGDEGRVVHVAADVTDPEAVEAALASVTASWQSPTVLVNNAGVFWPASISDTSPMAFEETLAVNLTAAYRLLHLALGPMIAAGRGHVVTIGSSADRTVYPGNAAYSASKYGLRVLHETARQETEATGVRCTLVSPRAVDTPLWDPLDPDNRPGFIPRARMIQASQVADAVVWALVQHPNVNIDELRMSPA